MNWLDYLILIILLLSIICGILRGFVREIIALVIWILALGFAIYFSPWLADKLVNSITQPNLRIEFCFIGLFVSILLFGMWFNAMIGKSMNLGGVSAWNLFVGGLFGFIRGIVMVAILLLIGEAQAVNLNETQVWQDSKLVPSFLIISNTIDKMFNSQLACYTTGVVNKMNKKR